MSEPKDVKSNAGAQICDREGNPVTDSCASEGKLLGLLYGTAPAIVVGHHVTRHGVHQARQSLLSDHPVTIEQTQEEVLYNILSLCLVLNTHRDKIHDFIAMLMIIVSC